MKAIVVREFGTIEHASFCEIDDAVAARGEVVIDIEAVDVNYPDILYFEGKYQNLPRLPFSPGLGGAGIISALGGGVEDLQLGQKVLVLPSHGTYAEKVSAPRNHCFPIPDSMSFDVAAALGLVYQTAYFALFYRAMMKAGDVVLVLGASGGIGMAAIQLAKSMGAGMVIAATRGAEGAAFARGLGADATVDTGGENLRDGLRDAVLAATDSRGADVVIDPVGGEITLAALRVIAWSGHLTTVGFASGAIPTIGANHLLVKNISVSGLQWTDYRKRDPSKVAAAQNHIFDLWKCGSLSPTITSTLPLDKFAAALAPIQMGCARGKTILTL